MKEDQNKSYYYIPFMCQVLFKALILTLMAVPHFTSTPKAVSLSFTLLVDRFSNIRGKKVAIKLPQILSQSFCNLRNIKIT